MRIPCAGNSDPGNRRVREAKDGCNNTLGPGWRSRCTAYCQRRCAWQCPGVHASTYASTLRYRVQKPRSTHPALHQDYCNATTPPVALTSECRRLQYVWPQLGTHT
jgi:hypothetical protein